MTDLDPMDLLITGARVLDPETGFDRVANVGVRDGTVAHLGAKTVPAATVINASGKVVTPGFIDLHTHAQNVTGHRLQVLDGVTTALELEAGALPLPETYRWAEREGRPANYGYSAAWLYARMHVMDGAALVDPADDPAHRVPLAMFSVNQEGKSWMNPADSHQLADIVALLREELDEGALGIGTLLGYAPGTDHAELEALGGLCAEFSRPLFVHGRHSSNEPGRTCADTVAELARVARVTGCAVHLCHMVSTAQTNPLETMAALEAAQAEGLNFSTESYTYGTASTVIGADFLAPQTLASHGLTPRSIFYLPTGERPSDLDRLHHLRRADPGGLCLIDYYDEADPRRLRELTRAITFPGAAFASDAMPVTYRGPAEQAPAYAKILAENPWPVPDEFICHPRSTSCFTRALAWLHRDLGELSLIDAVARCTLIPARIAGAGTPSLARKGRVQVGADADLVVFDPARLMPSTDFFHIVPGTGMDLVLVDGHPVVRDGRLDPQASPGRPVRAGGRGGDGSC